MEPEKKNRNNILKLFLVMSSSFLITIIVSATGLGIEIKLTENKEAKNLATAIDAKNNTQFKETDKEKFLEIKKIAEDTVQNHIPKEGKFIAADLTNMKLSLYENESLFKEYPIISKGKPESFWETPSGDYKILEKIPNHFSSVGEVYMPYSMQFYGNFFIHGWPYYPDGQEVSQGYSGGCIRLKTDDAKGVYHFADKNTPIFVYESEDANSPSSDITLKNIPAPRMSSKSFLIADINTGQVFLEKNTTQVMSIASITKLMTAITANEVIMFDRNIAITDEVLETYGDSGNLRKGETITANNILYPLLMESSNDAAKALAVHYGEKDFISSMNKKAKALGMKNTNFSDSSGISGDNTSTAYDLYILSKYLKNKKSFILNITKLPTKKIQSSLYEHTFQNFNIFSYDQKFLGGKTGYSKAANETMLSVFEIPVNEENHDIAFIVLNSDNRERDIKALLKWFEEATL